MPPFPSDSDVEDDPLDVVPYNFPKIELHCHLDGTFRVSTILDLARKRGIHLPTFDEKELRKLITISSPCKSLNQYLDPFFIFTPTYAGDAEAIARITREAIEDKAKDGIAYIEFRYSPLLLANCDVKPVVHAKERGNLRPKDVVEVINKTIEEATADHQIKVKTILCDITTHNGWGHQTAQLCKEYSDTSVVGFDIAGPEGQKGYPADRIEAFQFCKMNGVHRTAHAGEAGPAMRVKMAIEQLQVERVGHGYHVIDDADVYELAKKEQTHFEVCPWSSHLTNSVPRDWSKHPAKRFMADGVNFSLNTDDPGLHQTTLLYDYDIAVNQWGFSTKDLQNLNLNAARSCFLNPAEKLELISDLETAYIEYKENDSDFTDNKYFFME